MTKLLAFALLLSSLAYPHLTSAAQVNILFIAIDDLWPEIGAYGVIRAVKATEVGK